MIGPQRGIANTHSFDLVMMVRDRYERSLAGHEGWAQEAKRCFNFMEGDQWPREDRDLLESAGRPALTFNEIAPLVRLVLGFFAQNRTEYEVVSQGMSEESDKTAEVLSHLLKMIDESNEQEYTDFETFLNGIVGGRGFQDTRLSFEDNDLGEIVTRDQDPFSTFLDPDATDYDLNRHNYVMTSRMVSLDEAEIMFGRDLAISLAGAMGTRFGTATHTDLWRDEEVAPWRGFGGGDIDERMSKFNDGLEAHYDRFRKTVRLVDMQHHVRVRRNHFIDLTTGDRKAVPEDWTPEKTQQTLDWLLADGHKFVVQSRLDNRVRHTIMCGDVICYDDWSPYQQFTISGYFPYFRQGKTRGMVTDLIDPQVEKNKRRSAQVDIISRTAAGGWMYPEGALDPEQEANLEMYGSTPGITIKYRSPELEPKQLKPVSPPSDMARLEMQASDDMRRISGINESALGEVDKVQSGRAIENRQRQSVIGLQFYMDSWDRFKLLGGQARLSLIQSFYTEQRLVAIRGEDGKKMLSRINEPSAEGRIINDVTMGKFMLTMDTAPAAKTFEENQFEQVMAMVERGMIPPEAADLVIEMSSLPNKESFKQRIRTVMQAKGVPIPPDESAIPAEGAPAIAAPEVTAEMVQPMLPGV